MASREETQSHVKPAPSLVIALDALSIEVAVDAQNILLNCHPRQAALTTFLGLGFSVAEGEGARPHNLTLCRLGDHRAERIYVSGASPPGEESDRRKVFEHLVAEREQLHSQLGAFFRELRTHERLIEAGLGSEAIIPLDVILIADLASSTGSGTLLPLIGTLQKLLEHDAYGMGHLLLSMANFSDIGIPDPTEAIDPSARLYAAIRELEALADPRQDDFRRKLAGALGLAHVDPLQFRAYLFDHRKEGGSEVRDTAELRLILVNFLAGMLSGGLARRLTDGLPWAEIQDRKAFFNSAAATALIFNPGDLIDVCAARLGIEFLDAEMLTADDARLPYDQALVAGMISRLEEPLSWVGKLCRDTPLEVSGSDNAWKLSLHFSDLNFEGIPEEGWAEAIQGYASAYEAETLPDFQASMRANSKRLSDEIQERLAAEIAALPQHSRYYPGGLLASREAIGQLGTWLDDVEAVVNQTPTLSLDASLETYLQALSQAAGQVRPLPASLASILRIFSHFIEVDAMIRWWRYRDTDILARREYCVRLMESIYAAQLERTAREFLHDLVEELRPGLLSALEQLDSLSKKLKVVREELARKTAAYPPPESAFRLQAVDAPTLEDTFQAYKPTPEVVRHTLLEKQKLLRDWQDVDVEALITRVMAYGREAYAPLMEVTLEKIIRRRAGLDAQSALAALGLGAVPLLKPDFDVIGGGSAPLAGYVLLPTSQGTDFHAALGTSLKGWECIPTSAPSLVVCTQVRHLIPLTALKNLLRQGEKAYQELEASKRSQLHSFEVSF